MITLYGFELEIYQVVLLIYVVGYGLVLGICNTWNRFRCLFVGVYIQSTRGRLLDGLWYGCIFVLVGTLV